MSCWPPPGNGAADLASSWVVGDKLADVDLGRGAGGRTALVLTGYGGETASELASCGVRAEVVGEDLDDVIGAILEIDKGGAA